MIKYKFQVVENFLDHQDFESLCNLNIDREIKTSCSFIRRELSYTNK